MELRDCLAVQTWRHLRAISQANGLGFDANLTKTQAVDRLAAWLGGDEHLACLTALPVEARAGLRELVQVGGQMGSEVFAERFGPLRPYRPWRSDAPPAPWTEPQSATERLVYRGLIFAVTLGRARHSYRVLVLPDEFHEPVMAHLSLTLPAALDVPRSFAPSPLCLDLLTLVGYLQREDVRPIWGRWLPPTSLRTLNQLLVQPEDLRDVRSERRARRIPFLHYLAKAAGLIAPTADLLKPTPVVQSWLERPSAERVRTLWNAWRESTESNEALWVTFQLPTGSAPAPVDRFRRLCRALACFPVGCALSVEDWLIALDEMDPFLLRPTPVYDDWAALSADEQAKWRDTVGADLNDLFTGPLTWFGVFASLKDASLTPKLVLTPLGAALLGRDDGEWSEDPPPESLHVVPRPQETDEELAVLCAAPPGLPWTARFSLEALVSPLPGAPVHYRLTRASVLRALQRGHSVEGIMALLETLSDEPLPLPIFALLDEWGAAYGEVTIRPVTLLQVRDPALLRRLAAVRRLRTHFGETLSDRAVCVDSSRLPQLLRALERRGLMPCVEAGLAAVPVSAQGDLAPAERAFIVAALELYAALGESLADAPPVPYALLERWGQSLTAAERDAAKRAVRAVLDGLRRAGHPAVRRPHLPTPTGPLLERLETAIAGGEMVTIIYYTASRDHTSTRRITPLRLEWRGETAYCVAHCHLRGAERVFRVDRIGEIVMRDA